MLFLKAASISQTSAGLWERHRFLSHGVTVLDFQKWNTITLQQSSGDSESGFFSDTLVPESDEKRHPRDFSTSNQCRSITIRQEIQADFNFMICYDYFLAVPCNWVCGTVWKGLQGIRMVFPAKNSLKELNRMEIVMHFVSQMRNNGKTAKKKNLHKRWSDAGVHQENNDEMQFSIL